MTGEKGKKGHETRKMADPASSLPASLRVTEHPKHDCGAEVPHTPDACGRRSGSEGLLGTAGLRLAGGPGPFSRAAGVAHATNPGRSRGLPLPPQHYNISCFFLS